MKRIAFLLSVIFVVSACGAAWAGGRARAADRDPVVRHQGLQHFRKWLEERGLRQGDFKVVASRRDDLGMGHLELQQRVGGVPVVGGEVIVHLLADGALAGITDDSVPAIGVGRKGILKRRAVRDLAITAVAGCADCFTRPALIDRRALRLGEEDHFVYRVRLFREDGTDKTSMPVVFVDAHSGAVVHSYDNLQTAVASGSGTSLYSGTVPLDTFEYAGNFYLEDYNRALGTFDFSHTVGTLTHQPDADNFFDAVAQQAAVDVHYGTAMTYDYFLRVHGRPGFDGAAGPLTVASIDGRSRLMSSRVRYGVNYSNAYWNGQEMTYGDGNGVNALAPVSLDTAGHELVHCVVDTSAGLLYWGEPGAVNESWADVFGAMVERYAKGFDDADTWRFGEDWYTPAIPGDAIRYMDDPHAAADNGYTWDDDPDHYTELYTGDADNGGVHINSGIGNKAFHLLAMGGSHHRGGTMTGIGPDAAAAIWYRALTTYMTPSTNFVSARRATQTAAIDLYGPIGAEVAAVEQAWCMVGVGSCPGAPVPIVVNGGLEGSVAPFVVSGTGAFYTASGRVPHGGSGYAWFGRGSDRRGHLYQQITVPVSASGDLTFWLNVTSSETTNSLANDQFFVEVRGTTGALLATLATYSNLDKVASADIYSQKTHSLAAYKGQTVRLQFRVVTDAAANTTFRVDDVAVN